MMHAAVMVSLFENGSDGRTAHERSRGKRAPLCLGQNKSQSEQAGSEVPQWSVCRTEVGNPRDGHRHGVVRAAANKRMTEPERFVWNVLNAFVGAPWKPTPGAQRKGDEVPVQRAVASCDYQCAQRSGRSSRPTQSLHVYRCGTRENRMTPGCSGCDAILARGTAKNPSCGVQRQHDERVARRVQAGEERRRPRADSEDERDAVRPRAMQTDISQVLVICRWKTRSTSISTKCEATF